MVNDPLGSRSSDYSQRGWLVGGSPNNFNTNRYKTSSTVSTPTDILKLETTPTLINIIWDTSTPEPSSSTVD